MRPEQIHNLERDAGDILSLAMVERPGEVLLESPEGLVLFEEWAERRFVAKGREEGALLILIVLSHRAAQQPVHLARNGELRLDRPAVAQRARRLFQAR
jgi:hypothetical protein